MFSLLFSYTYNDCGDWVHTYGVFNWTYDNGQLQSTFGFIEDKDKYLERFEQFTRKVDVIKISEEDYSYLYGEQDFEKVTAEWLDKGIKMVVLTLGEKGAKVIYDGGKEISVGTEEVKVIDTIAAGDSFNAGLLFHLDKQKILDQEKLASIDTSTLKKALTFAHQVASFTVTQKGANPPWLHQIIKS